MKKIAFAAALIMMFAACAHREAPETPKPVGYFRIEVPPHSYRTLDTLLPFSFDYSDYASCSFENKGDNTVWLFLKYPAFNADIDITYMPLRNDLHEKVLAEDKLISNHYQIADDVEYSIINDPESRLFGQIYDIKGKSVACPLSFWMTDSTSHYFRGALYFNHAPNNDSLQPVIDYIREDVLQLIETFQWK
ncbi:MAG: hypothetical protein J6W84_06635 [Bacteroidales bacterium]|nr:hypothetical protein [Bacteroidales bacterium]MBQ7489954.1 hypothetical protein [Bacteroidales bacterium]